MQRDEQKTPRELKLAGTFDPSDKKKGDYAYLPFDVPVETRRVDVRYDYTRSTFAQSRAGDETVIDIGILAPSDEFRGWSGGARDCFFIENDSATPGYIPGPLPAGQWTIVLGLYRIANEGCSYEVTIRLDSTGARHGDSATTRAPGADRGLAAEPDHPVTDYGTAGGWLIGDLQSHTLHSDAGATVPQLARVARDRGLHFLAVTDHNTISHHRELVAQRSDSFLLIPGMEITTYYGHANVWGLTRWIDFRYSTSDEIAVAVGRARGQGALASINHPHTDCPWEYGWIDGFASIEVWQGLWNRANLAAVTWWDELLAAGVRVTGVGGSDRHEPEQYDPLFPHQVGTPTTRVQADRLETRSILKAIEAGRVTISAAPDAPWIELSLVSRDGREARIGETLAAASGQRATLRCRIPGGAGNTLEIVRSGSIVDRVKLSQEVTERDVVLDAPGYLRANLIAASPREYDGDHYPEYLALANPVYVEAGGNGGTSRPK